MEENKYPINEIVDIDSTIDGEENKETESERSLICHCCGSFIKGRDKYNYDNKRYDGY